MRRGSKAANDRFYGGLYFSLSKRARVRRPCVLYTARSTSTPVNRNAILIPAAIRAPAASLENFKVLGATSGVNTVDTIISKF
jgi:hypothetical protein